MLFARREPDHIARPDLLDRTAPPLHDGQRELTMAQRRLEDDQRAAAALVDAVERLADRLIVDDGRF